MDMKSQDLAENLRQKWPYSEKLSEDDMDSLYKDLDYAAKWGIGNVEVASNEYGLSAHYRITEERTYELVDVKVLTETEKQRIRNLCP